MDRQALVIPTPQQRQWHDMELGMFFHFDIPIFSQDWYFRCWRDVPQPDLYQPSKLDTDQWMEAAKAMGATYAVFVAKHCSGFLQWQSDLYPYGVRQSSWRGGKGDVVGDFVASCRKYGLKPGLYASASTNAYFEVDNPGLVNRGKGGDAAAQRAYVKVCEQMVEELWSRYGELFEIWFDGGAIPVEDGGPDLIPILERHQPDAVVFQGPVGTRNLIRWIGNERGVAPYPCWSTIDQGTAEGGDRELILAGSPDGRLWIPGECDVPIRNHEWFWKPDQEHKIYPLEELMEMYYCSVGRNCNLLLNANPGPDGLVPEADMRQYEAFGREIRRRFGKPLGSTSGTGEQVELDLGAPVRVDHVAIREDIGQGERIRGYRLEALTGGESWQELATGTCVGHQRIERFEPLVTPRIRLTVTASRETPQIRQLTAYGASST